MTAPNPQPDPHTDPPTPADHDSREAIEQGFTDWWIADEDDSRCLGDFTLGALAAAGFEVVPAARIRQLTTERDTARTQLATLTNAIGDAIGELSVPGKRMGPQERALIARRLRRSAEAALAAAAVTATTNTPTPTTERTEP